MTVGSTGTVSFIGVAFAVVGSSRAGHSHAFLGILVFVLTSLQVALGVLSVHEKAKADGSPDSLQFAPAVLRGFRFVHRQVRTAATRYLTNTNTRTPANLTLMPSTSCHTTATVPARRSSIRDGAVQCAAWPRPLRARLVVAAAAPGDLELETSVTLAWVLLFFALGAGTMEPAGPRTNTSEDYEAKPLVATAMN